MQLTNCPWATTVTRPLQRFLSSAFDQTVGRSLCVTWADQILLQLARRASLSPSELFEVEDRLRARKNQHRRFHMALPMPAAWVVWQLLRSNPYATTLSRSGPPRSCSGRETDKARASEPLWE